MMTMRLFKGTLHTNGVTGPDEKQVIKTHSGLAVRILETHLGHPFGRPLSQLHVCPSAAERRIRFLASTNQKLLEPLCWNASKAEFIVDSKSLNRLDPLSSLTASSPFCGVQFTPLHYLPQIAFMLTTVDGEPTLVDL